MYCEQVRPAGGFIVEYSTAEQVICCPPSPKRHIRLSSCSSKRCEWERYLPLPISASTRYVYGERRYIHLHHPSCLNGCNTPLLIRVSLIRTSKNVGGWTYKINTNENVEVNNSPAISTVGAAAATA